MSEQAKCREAFSKMARGRGQRYGPELKAQAVSLAKAERRAGVSWKTIAEGIGVHAKTLRDWCTSAGETRMHRVQVVKEKAASTLSVVSPTGYRMEGLSLEQATALMAKLG